ncbi:RES family NAD+ phosphorylase [Kiloniella majae]|uniref:RES family NAD+ phosphorylase n=1 Tax=Kiloniella majae TaxID=1938558 RepID=UPI000A27707D|nr:RES family NAD+ phosphorylase [Kiloniella majae]
MVRKRRDNNLIDAIESIDPLPFSSTVWRITRKERDPTQCSRSGGRWDDGTFDVLYTSAERHGAINEMKFHLLRGQPIIPSLVSYSLYELDVSLDRALKILDINMLEEIGLDTSKYGQLSYENKDKEYPRSQDIAEVAHFLEYDGLVVPSARHQCMNVVIFCDRVPPDTISVKKDHGTILWDKE